MAKYRKRPKSWVEDDVCYDDQTLITSIEVCDHEAVNTGLLDADGDEIWREPNPIGFGRDGEW